MKGAVFIILNEMVESQYGIEAWEDILNTVQPESGGIYISTENYSDEEVVKYVIAISEKLSLPTTDVTRVFGTYLFSQLNKKYDVFSKMHDDLFPFLCSIENTIHKEVEKLYHNPSLPTLDVSILDDNNALIKYTSPRKLCYLAEGLIGGAAEHYKENITIKHETCMHNGAEHCELLVSKS